MGRSPRGEAEQLEAHLEGCRQCLETVQALQSDDTFVEALRQSGGDTTDLEKDVRASATVVGASSVIRCGCGWCS